MKCRSYNNFDDILFQQDVEELDWSRVLNCPDIEPAAALFHDILNGVVNKHAPFVNVKLSDNAPKWFTLDYLSHVNEREFLKRKYNKCPCPEHRALHLDSKKMHQESQNIVTTIIL